MKNYSIAIVIPVYNDWKSLKKLQAAISGVLSHQKIQFVIVDDCSSVSFEAFQDGTTTLELNQNLGHQRAIAVGLCYVNEFYNDIDFVVVMDADGEDRPDDIGILIDEADQTGLMVFAQRNKRQEGIIFKVLYAIYLFVYKVLVGSSMRFGNFSVIPFPMLQRITSNPNLWNHYSASISNAQIEFSQVACDRGKRYFGQSKMNLNALIIHGLSAISIQIEVVVIRFLIWSAFAGAIILLTVLGITVVRLTSDLLVPGWASLSLILLMILSASIFGISLILALTILLSRNTVKRSPNTFYTDFIRRVKKFKSVAE